MSGEILVVRCGTVPYAEAWETQRRLQERLLASPAAFWVARLERAGVPSGVVRSVQAALADVDASPLTGVAPSIPGTVRFAPPRLGEHDDVVRRLGWAAFG